MGRGKIERVFGMIQQQFLVEVAGEAGDPPGTRLPPWKSSTACSTAWVRMSTTPGPFGDRPNPACPPGRRPGAAPDPALLRQAFAWSVIRQVRKTATVLEGNAYSVDPFLPAGKSTGVRPVRHDELTVYWAGPKVGRAVPQVIGRHAHPKAPPDEDPGPRD